MAEALSKKEKEFCRYYADVRNAREAAILAGYTVMPLKTGLKLLSRAAVSDEIRKTTEDSKQLKDEAVAGFRRLAFGSVADAVKLMCGEITDIESLDLYMVSDIKIPKGGGMEIKFFDRQKALECLAEIENNTADNSALPFYKALEKSAAFITQNGVDCIEK